MKIRNLDFLAHEDYTYPSPHMLPLFLNISNTKKPSYISPIHGTFHTHTYPHFLHLNTIFQALHNPFLKIKEGSSHKEALWSFYLLLIFI
ncbi:hypothetical protein Hanom_Chr15g01395991 [Helianthus anomalus]